MCNPEKAKRLTRTIDALKQAHLSGFSYGALGTQYNVSPAYVQQVVAGKRPPSARLMRRVIGSAIEHRPGVRVRMTRAEAEQVARGVVPAGLRARVAGAVAAKECGQ